ncbi:hypothetical protein ARMSODRAFT_1081913 [Armillaria solidipes]|uniref:Uncharacterized protein n=1 Tax=Armillaria solidipes TaxID=1076256 RepID=A0A2H3BSD0_9AGAR|nr:hypothetical protein ARMSODRAFT_1081913 [Armillaria solidipes]
MASNVDELQKEISALKELQAHVGRLRKVPHDLLNVNVKKDTRLQEKLEEVQRAKEAVESSQVQQALEHAASSEKKDGSGVDVTRGSVKRRSRSPQPYVAEKKTKKSIFPEGTVINTTEELKAWMRTWNRDHSGKVHLWRARRGDTGDDIVRVVIPDVLQAYLFLGAGRRDELSVEAVTVFGPREKRAPHASSSFDVFRLVTERVSGMAARAGGAGVAEVVSALEAYGGLFVARCALCGRVLSREGHVPPVGLIWGDGRWECRHLTCHGH